MTADIAPIQTDHKMKWTKWDEFRYSVRSWLQDHFPPYNWFSDAYYYFYHRIRQSHMIDTRIGKGHFCDKVGLIQYGLLELVDDFVARDQEDAFSTVDWDSDERHQEVKAKIIQVLYFKNVWLPHWENYLEKTLHEHFEKWPVTFGKIDEATGLGMVEFAGKDDPACKEDREVMNTVERMIEEETQKILHMIIDIRCWLWT